MFVGYPFGQKGWHVYDLERGEYFMFRDVVFSEHLFPYAARNESISTISRLQPIVVEVVGDFDDE